MNYKLIEITCSPKEDRVYVHQSILSEEKLNKILNGESNFEFGGEYKGFLKSVEVYEDNDIAVQETLETNKYFYPGTILEIEILKDKVDKNIVKKLGLLEEAESSDTLEENDLVWK